MKLGTLSDTGSTRIHIPYFLEFFPQVLLISECANMRVQFEGGNNTRVGTINIATLPCSYTHCASGRFSQNESEISA